MASTVWNSVRFSPWQFDAASYVDVADSSPVVLVGNAAETPWDDELQRIMQDGVSRCTRDGDR